VTDDGELDAAVSRMRDREASARVLERELSLRDWLTEQFVKRDDDEREREENE
jgi:hypothetical protein